MALQAKFGIPLLACFISLKSSRVVAMPTVEGALACQMPPVHPWTRARRTAGWQWLEMARRRTTSAVVRLACGMGRVHRLVPVASAANQSPRYATAEPESIRSFDASHDHAGHAHNQCWHGTVPSVPLPCVPRTSTGTTRPCMRPRCDLAGVLPSNKNGAGLLRIRRRDQGR